MTDAEDGLPDNISNPQYSARPVTLFLQAPVETAGSPFTHALATLNDIVKSPLFVFLVGSSLVGCWPSIDRQLHPAKAADERNRADIALVVPLISDLKNDDTLKLDATQAILRRLRDSGAQAANDGESPIFEAAYGALAPVAAQARPSPSATSSDDALEKISQDTSDSRSPASTGSGITTPVTTSSEPPTVSNVALSLSALAQGSLVYIQAARDSAASKSKAQSLMQSLQENQVLAPPVQNMACKTIPRATQVRFFNDVDRSRAQDLAGFVARTIGIPTAVVQPKLSAKPGTLEVWLGRDVDLGLTCST